MVDPAISGLIEIRPGAPATLNFIGLPTGGLAGLALTPAVSVQVVDAHGHSVIDGTPVSLTIASGPSGAGITGGAATTLDGLATFPAVVLDTAGSHALRATAGQAQATSSTVTVAPNEPAHISFIVEPSDAIALEPIVPTVVVDVVNTAIRPVPNGTEVTLQVAFGPADAQISGHVATTSSGIAGFPDLSLSPHGLYMLRAVSGQAEIDSEPFEVFEQVLFANGFELEE